MNQNLNKLGACALLLAAIAFSSDRTQAQVAIPPSAKVTADTSKPGFNWTMFANAANTSDNDVRPENALAGLLVDVDGNPLPNLADPNAPGVAIAAAVAPSPANAPIKFEISTVINVSSVAADGIGTFTPDDQMPGVPATDGSNNGLSVEILTYLDLPAGVTTMGVTSDDGFTTTTGNIADAFGRVTLGSFIGGRGFADTVFTFSVAEAGVYPFRTVYEQGGGDANIEWWTLKADGTTKVLVNDIANGGIKAYRARVGSATADTYIKSVIPNPAPRQFNIVSPSLTIVLSDGDAKTVDDTSIALQVDGQTVTPTKVRQGKVVTLTYTPAGLQIPTDQHTAALTYKDSTGVSRTQQWPFRNLKNIVLPAPKITENFDSYPEDTQPTGWVATNFTSHDADGRDITNQKSESYENWVLVSTANMTSLDGGAANVAPGQTFNGQPVTSISSGNVLYAESDGRANTDSAGGSNAGQAQFIVSAAFDCSQLTNVVLTLSALYTQNQDSLGAIEYSVDGGTSWLPVVYYLEPPDIVINPNGTVNAVSTFTNANTDTANWVDNGVAKGDNYGDGIAAPITAALGDYIAPRVNDDQFEGARIEVFRLAQASKKSDVRLRFAQLGTDSWWFAVDNIAFYDVPVAQPPPVQPKVTGQWDFDQGDLRATVGQDMQYGDNLVKSHTSFGTTTSFGIPDIGGKAAKVMKFTRIDDSEYPDPANKNPLGYLTPTGMSPNGGGTKVNQFTMIVDMMNPDLHLGDQYNTVVKWEDIDNLSRDGSISIKANDIGGDNTGGIGISGQYSGDGVTWIIGGQWQRIVVAVNMVGDPNDPLDGTIDYYIDGVKFGQMDHGDRWGFDQRHAIPPVVRLYGDGENDNEVNTYYVNSVQFREGTMTAAEAAALGAATADGIPSPSTPPPPQSPTISVSRSGNNITLSWPASATGFTLEGTSTLTNPTWTAVPGVANNSVTVPTTTGNQYYRLRK